MNNARSRGAARYALMLECRRRAQSCRARELCWSVGSCEAEITATNGRTNVPSPHFSIYIAQRCPRSLGFILFYSYTCSASLLDIVLLYWSMTALVGSI
ncbi:hypothetical protein BDW71DRAFT_145653 [Aspergillus fruticulosus]